MSVKLAVVSLWARDVDQAARFYRGLIGLDAVPHHGGRPHFDLGGVYLVLLKGKPRRPVDPDPKRFPVLAFAVESLDRTLETLEAHGVALPWPVEKTPGTRYVVLNDPADNLIELVEYTR